MYAVRYLNAAVIEFSDLSIKSYENWTNLALKFCKASTCEVRRANQVAVYH